MKGKTRMSNKKGVIKRPEGQARWEGLECKAQGKAREISLGLGTTQAVGFSPSRVTDRREGHNVSQDGVCPERVKILVRRRKNTGTGANSTY